MSYLQRAVKSRQFHLGFLRFRQVLSRPRNLRNSPKLALRWALFRGSVTVCVALSSPTRKGERMHVNVGKEVAALEAMTVNELRAKYAQVFGEETRVGNKAWLVKRIIWRLQALAE